MNIINHNPYRGLKPVRVSPDKGKKLIKFMLSNMSKDEILAYQKHGPSDDDIFISGLSDEAIRIMVSKEILKRSQSKFPGEPRHYMVLLHPKVKNWVHELKLYLKEKTVSETIARAVLTTLAIERENHFATIHSNRTRAFDTHCASDE